MTAPTTTTLASPAPDVRSADVRPTEEPAGACPACPHPLADHDPIGLRFCRATAAGAMTRGCVCRPA